MTHAPTGAQAQAREAGRDLVVVVSAPDQALQPLQGALASSDGAAALAAALQSAAGLRMAPDSLRLLPPATEE
jgi:hypothetical protein